MIEFKHKQVMNIISNHVWFSRLSGTGFIPLKLNLKSNLYYDEKIFGTMSLDWNSLRV